MEKLRYNYGNYEIPIDVHGGICVDVGCNNGSFLLNNKKIFKAIHAYEPNLDLYALLVNEYKHDEHISIFNKAIGKNDGDILSLVKYTFNNDDGSYGIYDESRSNYWNEDNKVCHVESISLETILKNIGGKINYLKMDCECSEYNGLMNKNLEFIDYIGIELHGQLGLEKYNNLYNFILNTHTTNDVVNWNDNHNQEILFKNKKL